jgi:hypothetical protein
MTPNSPAVPAAAAAAAPAPEAPTIAPAAPTLVTNVGVFTTESALVENKRLLVAFYEQYDARKVTH